MEIDEKKLWNDTNTYKVIDLSFAGLTSDWNSLDEFKESLISMLRQQAMINSLPVPDTNIPSAYIDAFANAVDVQELVLLIDEYDAPLIHSMDDPVRFKQINDTLAMFYDRLKVNSSKFRFFFITGITKASKVNIFSAFNNLWDLSMEVKYGTLLGYTGSEIEKYFLPYIANLAEVFDCDIAEVYKNLQIYYDGYCFDEMCSTHVYNTWSILNILKKEHSGAGYQPYWSESGGLSSLVINYLKKITKSKDREFFSILALDDKTRKPLTVSGTSLRVPDVYNHMQPEILMYQAGYLTLKKRLGTTAFEIDVPNLEVKNFLMTTFLEKVYSLNTGCQGINEQLSQAGLEDKLLSGKSSEIKKAFDSILNSFAYDTELFKANESFLRDLISFALMTQNILALTEKPNGKGRSDLIVEFSTQRVVFEFKLAKSADDVRRLLNEAKKQIIVNDYGDEYPLKKLYRYAVVLSQKDRKVADIELVN